MDLQSSASERAWNFKKIIKLDLTLRRLMSYIQGDSGGICKTLGNDSMYDSKQKSSYKHVSDFRRLRSYGHFLIPVHALMWTAVAYRVRCQLTGPPSQSSVRIPHQMSQRKLQRAQFTTERQPVLRAAVAFSKTSFKHRSVQIKGNFTKLTLHLYFKCIMYYAGLIITRQILKFVCLLLAYCLSVLNMDSKHDSRIEIK